MLFRRIRHGLYGLVIPVVVVATGLVNGTTAQASTAGSVARASGAVSALTVLPSTTASGVADAAYLVSFTASGTGGLIANQGTVTLSLPAGSQFHNINVFQGNVSFDDVTTGATGSILAWQGSVSDNDAALTVATPITISAGDQVVITYTDVTNATATGTRTATFTTSSDTTAATATFGLTADRPAASFGDVSLTSTAAGASQATYTAEFTASSTGALVAGWGTITLTAPAGTVFGGPVTVHDLTTGQVIRHLKARISTSRRAGRAAAGNVLSTVTVSSAIAAGDRVKVSYADVTSASGAGTRSLSIDTSSDTVPVSTSFHLTPAEPVSSFGNVSLSSTAAGATGVTYKAAFTASATGALVPGAGQIVLAGPAGTVFSQGGAYQADDVTTGAIFNLSAAISGNGTTVSLSGWSPISAGDHVVVTAQGVTNSPSTGTMKLSLNTTSDTKPVSSGFALTRAGQVAAPDAQVSTQATGASATYTVAFTTSATGEIAPGYGQIVLAAPTGTTFGAGVTYKVDDITSGQIWFLSPASTSNGGATVALSGWVPIDAGDQITITAAGVTNPTTTGKLTMNISTSSDTVPAVTPSYLMGPSAPVFTTATPPLTVSSGSGQQYTFAASGYPAPEYSLTRAPSWLRINLVTGQLSGTVPAGTRSFSFFVNAANSAGTATEGPYQVAVGGGVTISGTVVNSGDDPVANVAVDACDTSGGACESAITGDSGTFSLAALADSTVMLTAYPPQGSGQATSSSAPIKVPAAGLTGVKITMQAGLPPIPGTLKINGSSTPTVYWASPSTATLTGCKEGLATVTVAGENIETGKPATNVITLTETPPGSGFYTGTVPPQEPVHGPVDIYSTIWCPSGSPLLPEFGPSSGGTSVFVTGSGFTGTTAVDFGAVPAESYSVGADDAIKAVAPPGTGTVPVTVYDKASPGGDVVGKFTYQQVTSIAPTSGPAKGGTWVIIKGTGLSSTQEVLFGKTGAEQFYVLGDDKIEALSPPGSGTQDITVSTFYGGTTAATQAGKFTYTAAAGPAKPAPVKPAQAKPAVSTPPSGPTTPAVPPGHTRPQVAHGFSIETIKQFVLAHLAEAVDTQGLYDQINKLIDAMSSNNSLCQQAAQVDAVTALIGVEPFIGVISFGAALAIEALIAFAIPGVGLFFGPFLIPLITIIVNAALDALAYNYIWGTLDHVDCGGHSAAPGSPGDTDNTVTPAPDQPPLGPGNASTLPYPHCMLHPRDCGGDPDGTFDPSGTVLDTHGHLIKGATVTVLRSYTVDGGYLPVSTSMPGLIPEVNPQITRADGTFDWDVSAGFYKIEASAPRCTAPGSRQKTAVIGPYRVPPPRVGLTITLQCANEAKAARPTVTRLSVGSGPGNGGTAVTVLGANFTPAARVTFGTAAARKVSYLSPQALSVTAPKGSGLVDVRVITAGGTSAKIAADRFFFGTAPKVAKVAPASGPVSGGTKVTITGTAFTGVTAVSLDGVRAKSFSVRSATKIVAVTGQGIPGPGVVVVTNPAGSSSTAAAARFTYLAPATAYVASQSGIVPVTIATGKAGPVVKLPGATGVATLPDGQTVYVTSSKGVTPVSTTSGQAGGTVKAGTRPVAVAAAPGSGWVYVVSYGSGTVTPVSTVTGLPGKAIKVGTHPDAIAITPNGKTAYVVNNGSGTVTPVSTVTGLPGKAIKVGTHPDAIAITPNGKTAYVTNFAAGTVTPITIATGKAGRPIKTGSHPDAIVISPNGAVAYVLNFGSGTMTPIKTATGQVDRPVRTGPSPVAAAIAPGGRTVYVVSFRAGTIIPIVIATGKIGRAIKVGKYPIAITISP